MKRCLTVLVPLLLLPSYFPARAPEAILLNTSSLQTRQRHISQLQRSGDRRRSRLATPTQRRWSSESRGVSVRLAEGRNAPVVRVVPRDLISAIFDPVHIPAADVGEQVGQATPVIGVSIGGESVAYSVAYLSNREIVNDTRRGETDCGHVVTVVPNGHSLCPHRRHRDTHVWRRREPDL